MSDRALAATLACIALLLVATTSTMGSHEDRIDERIVHPYEMQVITHIPVVAGYEPFPPAVHCAAGSPEFQTFVYQEDFSAAHGWSLAPTTLAPTAPNLWHTTTFQGIGETRDGNKLYFGFSSGPAAGTFNTEDHVAGTIQSPWVTLPSEGDVTLTFNTKWQMEYLKGYDHMWVELLASDGSVHLLCSNNSTGRVDAAGVMGNSAYASCSPFHYSPCPLIVVPGLEDLPVPDLGYPAWETRSVDVPASLLGTDVRIQFTFDTADGAANWFLGWMVDEVSIGIQ